MTRRHSFIAAALVLVGCGGALAVYWLAIRESTDTLVKRAQLAQAAARFDEAERLAQQVLARDVQQNEALYIAGVSASELGRFPEAARYFDRISNESPRAADARFRAGEIFALRLFQPSAAEQRLIVALQLEPSHGGAQQQMSALRGLCGDTQAAAQLRLARVRQGKFSEMDLLILALGETVDDATMREQFARTSPNDPLTWLMQAHAAMRNRDLASAEELLLRVQNERSDLLVVSAMLGRVWLDRGEQDRLRTWQKRLPTGADASSDVWLVRGDWARQQGDDAGAVRCYAEALRLVPASQRANYQLGQLLSALGHAAEAEVYTRRAHILYDLLIAAQTFLKAGTPAAVERLIDISRRGRLMWEAWGWRQIARALPSEGRGLPQIDRPAPESPRILGVESDLNRLASEYPLPRFMLGATLEKPAVPVTESAGDTHQIAFTDDAEAAGLNFQYVPGDGPSEVGLRMFQFSGGGVAVLDFDQDGWPDLYLPQGHLWPPRPEDEDARLPTRDRLFRNLGNGHLVDVTEAGMLTGSGYGQGVTVGDYNSDGFPDVFVATLSHNRLYQNNGDGTWTDVTAAAGIAGDRWTTSCLMADLNGDGLPDIYAVHYLEAPDLYDRICRNHDGRPRRCSPFELEAAQDQLFLNLGDGRFEDVTREAGIVAPGGKGLGIVAADFDGSGRLSLFVANDMMPNFLFVNETDAPGARPRFAESALAAGVAYDRDGRAQGCMGIAIGDARGVGLLDLFVTNYYQESNTYYAQRPGRTFEDVTASVGLREPSLKMLGFGTQFLDADLDGWPDLVVLNGHVDDETYRGIPFHMRPQFFRNTGRGHFVELFAHSLGPWFADRYLGRGLARIDWNRDGREDFVATNLDSPAALLTNHTRTAGHSICLQLRGVRANRDAIGTTVRVRVGGRELMQQLTAGDGYESSNQRQLVFGLGDATSAEVLTIRWPGGATQQFHDVPAGREYLALEDRPTLLVLPRANAD